MAENNSVGWGTNLKQIKLLNSYPHNHEMIKWGFISGTFYGELAIVADYHPVPEGGNNDAVGHLNVRIVCDHSVDGRRIPKQKFPLPSELSKHHYQLNELGLIITELFEKKNASLMHKKGTYQN